MHQSDNDGSFGGPLGAASVLASPPIGKDSSRMSAVTPATVRRRILVVEDEMLIGMLLEDMLTDLGHEVASIVPRLKDAMAAVDRETYDLAILDVHLHGESAFPVAEALIAKNVPFVFATGYGERGLPETYRGRPVLQKPFAKDDLERVLKALFP
jgi:DNA-binding response OmpR family regulator